MEIINFTEHEFKKLQPYKLERQIVNTECQLYIHNTKDQWNKIKELIKVFFVQEGEYFSNKLYTLNELMDFKEHLTVPELIMPTRLVSIDGKVCAYAQEFIEQNRNLLIMLQDPQVPHEKKLELIYQVAKLIEKIEKSRTCRKYKFYIGDLHEANFIYNLVDKKIKVVDIDSSKIGRNKSSTSKYLTYNDKLWDFPQKYPLDSSDKHISNYNTTIISFVYMVLSYFGDTNISNCSVAQFYKYLQYLVDCGLSKQITDTFAQIYYPQDNVLEPEIFGEIDPNVLRKIKEKPFHEAIK